MNKEHGAGALQYREVLTYKGTHKIYMGWLDRGQAELDLEDTADT